MSGIQVIARAAEILRVCKDEPQGLSLGQIAERVKLPRSTVQRIVNALSAEGFLSSGPQAYGIRLGPGLHGLVSSSRVDVVALAHPHLRQLSEETGETVDLAVLRGDHMVFVDQIVGPQRLRAVSAVGETFPLYCTANGKASLTLVEDEAIKRALPAKLGRRTPATITSRGRLISEIAKIRGTGLALDLEEHSPGISALGMAFADSAGIIYAVSVPMPTVRFARSRPACARALQATVRSITSALRTGASS